MGEFVLILLVIFLVAFFYSSVGHGGASGYISVLSIFGVSAALIKPSALLLNIFVAGISFYKYQQKQHFRWNLFYPFAILSIPMAYLGSQIDINPVWYKRILGACLLIAVLRIVGVFSFKKKEEIKKLPFLPGLAMGAIIGFLSGIIGIGGGILLSPIILIFNWGTLKETSSVSALFIVINSIAGLFGLWTHHLEWEPRVLFWLVTAIAGGILGAYWGANKASSKILKNVLAGVLFIAALKLIFI